jgi:hypothetical protein
MKLTEAQKLEKLREAYYDPKMGLGSVDKLYRKLRSSGITRKEVGHSSRSSKCIKNIYNNGNLATTQYIASLMEATKLI